MNKHLETSDVRNSFPGTYFLVCRETSWNRLIAVSRVRSKRSSILSFLIKPHLRVLLRIHSETTPQCLKKLTFPCIAKVFYSNSCIRTGTWIFLYFKIRRKVLLTSLLFTWFDWVGSGLVTKTFEVNDRLSVCMIPHDAYMMPFPVSQINSRWTKMKTKN